MTLPDTIPILGFGWDDLLFMGLAAVMIGAALLVVTMRDIIRCGLAMIVCFAALAGLYVLAGATVVAAAQVVTDEQLNAWYVVPSVFDPAVPKAVAAAVAAAAEADPAAAVTPAPA